MSTQAPQARSQPRVVEASSNAGISILSSDVGSLYFGIGADNDLGFIDFNTATNLMRFGAGATPDVMSWQPGILTLGSSPSRIAAAGQLNIQSPTLIVINEDGAGADVRIEGENDYRLLFTDANVDRVGIGTDTPQYKLEVSGTFGVGGLAAFGSDVHVTGTVYSGAGSFHTAGWLQTVNRATPATPPAGEGRWYQQSGTPYFMDDGGTALELGQAAAASDHGSLTGLGDDDHSQYLHLGSRGVTQIVTGTVRVIQQLETLNLVSYTTNDLAITGAGFLLLNGNVGGIIINSAATDNDTIIRGDNDNNLVFVNAGTDQVGIGLIAPNAKLQVSGSFISADADFYGDAWVKDDLNVSGSYYVHGGSGDVNDDDVIDVLDVQLVANFLSGASTPTSEQFKRADVDADGLITYTDHKLVTDFFLGDPSDKGITDKILKIGLRSDTDYHIDYNLITNDFNISGSFGVAGDYTRWDPMAPPRNPYSMAGLAQDDEFDDGNFASGTWHWYDEPGGLTVAEQEYGVVLGGMTANRVQAVWQPIPTGTNYSFTIFSSPIHEQADDQKWGIVLIEATGSMATSDAYVWSGHRGSAGYGWQATYFTDYQTFNTDDFNSVEDRRPAGMFLRFRLEGSTWHFDWSEDGFHWVEDRYTRAERFSIQGIGIGGRNSDTDFAHIFSFARWTDSGADDQVLRGARVKGWYK
jgi:hypothetical protein